MTLTVADLGELRLIDEILLPGVSGSACGDDCAHVSIGGTNLLWSIDPCPTPAAAMLDCCTPDVWGHYTAAINLSDIAASGGKPIGMLVSLEMPDDTEIAFIEGFQRGLLETLHKSGATLLGGNVKSASRFNAIGTVLGTGGLRAVTRTLAEDECELFAIGSCGSFWAAIMGEASNWPVAIQAARKILMPALLNPVPQTQAGIILGNLPFGVAAMDCSDGLASAVQQLATINSLDVEVLANPKWAIDPLALSTLAALDGNLENACWQFGDWQLVCVVPSQHIDAFENALKGSALTRLGSARRGSGRVQSASGKRFTDHVMNKNFAGGYNSVSDINTLLDRFMRSSIFC